MGEEHRGRGFDPNRRPSVPKEIPEHLRDVECKMCHRKYGAHTPQEFADCFYEMGKERWRKAREKQP